MVRPWSRLAAWLVALSVSAGCGTDDGPAALREQGPEVTEGIVGRVVFEKRTISSNGVLSEADLSEVVPARYVVVEVVEERGGRLRRIARTLTDEDGRWGIGGTFAGGFRVLAFPESPAADDPSCPVRVQDLSGDRFAVESPPQTRVGPGDRIVVDLIATVEDPLRLAGAFNIVDVIQRAAEVWEEATGIAPDPVVVNWESGEKPGTFFDPATMEITLEGGVAGSKDCTDTDEFDDSVIAHEYMHFLIASHAHSSSPGGPHAGEDLVPNLAFEEGLADWFGAVVAGRSLYQDTFGNGDGSPFCRADCRFCDDLEVFRPGQVVGIGSEQSVYQLLWDLTDGDGDEIPDVDGDGVALPVAEILRAVRSFDRREDYTYVLTLLDRLVSVRSISLLQSQSLLVWPVYHDITLPPVDRPDSLTGFLNGRDIFPIPIRPGAAHRGFVVSGAPNPQRGFDAIRYYGLELDRRRDLTITLTLDGFGVGTGEEPFDLDLRLLKLDNTAISESTSRTSPVEVIGPLRLEPGRYVIAVFAFFEERTRTVSNSGLYTLEVR